MGSFDVGLRLRHDCANITTAFEWAAGHDNWIVAGELLTGSNGAYIMDARLPEVTTALRRIAARVAALDADLHGCITVQLFSLHQLLTDIASAIAAGRELTRSPLGCFRSVGWTCTAWFAAFGAPEHVDGLLARADHERSDATSPDQVRSDAHTVAAIMPLMVHSLVAILNEDFGRSRALSHTLATDLRDATFNVFVVSAAMSEVMLGLPDTALVTVAQLDDFDLPNMDGTEVRALAHLALGDAETATPFIERLAKRAATGVYGAESNDAMLLLTALAHHDGDDNAARDYLRVASMGRQPGTIAFGRHLARQLGIIDEYLVDVASLDEPGNPQGGMGATRSMTALRAELTRRGWA